jgi:aspartate aminotransferase
MMSEAIMNDSQSGSVRVRTTPDSCLHETFRLVEKHERWSRKRVIHLHVGEPYFNPPPEAVEALTRSVRDYRTQYSSAEGLPELRDALARKLDQKNSVNTTADKVFVCPGSTQGLFAILLAVADPGVEILLPEIHWPIYLQQALLAGLRPVFYRLEPDFRINPDAVISAASARTRILLINSPANPTGGIVDAKTIRTLLGFARKHNWLIISDEAYEDFVYEGMHISAASLENGLPESERRVFSVFTFSKSYAMTGYRLGYTVAPNTRCARALRVVQEASIIAPSTPVQFAGLAALHATERVLSASQSLKDTRDSTLTSLVERGLLSALPTGGWYALINLSSYRISGEHFASILLRERDVAVSPASWFAPQLSHSGAPVVSPSPRLRNFIRVAFCGSAVEVEEGFRRIKDCLDILALNKMEKHHAA